MDLIKGYQGSDSEQESEDKGSGLQEIHDSFRPSTSADKTAELKLRDDYRASSPATSEDEFSGNCVVLSDGDDSEAEFNQILELCRKQREGVKSKTSARPSVNLAKVFDSEYYNLPPIDDPQIHVEEDISLKQFGVVDSFVDFMVNIKPDKGMPILNYDTMLFDQHRNAIGEVFEIYGSVQNPMYAIRFNNKEDAERTLSVGISVFYAPQEELITKTVLAQELLKMKISDAANDGDDSNDDEKVFSDDESEAMYHAKKRAKSRPAPPSNNIGSFNRPPYSKKPRQAPHSNNMKSFQNPYSIQPMNFFNSPYF